jgi:hypothetical protein
MVANETNAAAKDEEAVQGSDPDVLISLLRGEGTTVTKEIDEADGNASVDVEDELN